MKKKPGPSGNHIYGRGDALEGVDVMPSKTQSVHEVNHNCP